MAATRDEIRAWVHEGLTQGASHVVIACDEFDHEDYPVLVGPHERVEAALARLEGESMQRVMEVYALHLPIEAQLAEARAWHCEPAPPRR